LDAAISEQLRKYVREPRVTVTITEYRSETASVLGAVNTPGVYPLTGATTLLQVLSKAGGLRNDAGNQVEITRRRAAGGIPLESAKADASGAFTTAEVNLRSLLEAKSPEQNIAVKSGDVVSVPRAELVYIVGAVRKPGGFVLNERESMTALQAVSMAEGVEKTSAPQRAKILRSGATSQRAEIPVDLSKIIAGQNEDVPLLANDILVVPTSGAKAAFYRSMEALVQAGVGVAIYH
jgi:polysaccharide biosynthesis/export protein